MSKFKISLFSLILLIILLFSLSFVKADSEDVQEYVKIERNDTILERKQKYGKVIKEYKESLKIDEKNANFVRQNLVFKFCNTIDRWENQKKEVSPGNFHGVQNEGVNVSFPFNGFEDSYEWCYNRTPDFMTKKDVQSYVCDVYMSMNTCTYFDEFYEEMEDK